MMHPVIIGVATIESRRESLLETLESLTGQFDELHVYANDYDPEIDVPGVIVYPAPEGDLGDSGKMWPFVDEYWTEWSDGLGDAYCFVIDDDLIFRPGTIEMMIEGIERYDRRAAVGFHGRRQFSPVSSFYGDLKSNEALRVLGTVPEDTPCTILGTGCTGWHSSLVSWSLDDFPQVLPDGRCSRNMADIWFSKKLQEAGIPRMVLAHQFGFVRHSKLVRPQDTIAHRSRGKDEDGNWKDAVQTEVFNSLEWTLDTP